MNILKFACLLALFVTSFITYLNPAQAAETYNLRLTIEPWMTTIDSNTNSNWPSTPENWRSFFAYYTSPDEGESGDVLAEKYIGHLTYTLTDSAGQPVKGVSVTLNAVGKGHASSFNDVCNSAFQCRPGPAKPIGTAQTTDENGRVTFSYSFQGNWPPPSAFTDIKLKRVTNPSALVWFKPEPRPNSIIKTSCYSTCIASENPETRWYSETKNNKGLKASDVFEMDLAPSVSDIDELVIGKDQISIHVINPVLQLPRAVETGPYANFGVGYASSVGRSNKVGATANSGTGLFFGQPFTDVQETWYACSKSIPKIAYKVPKDCMTIPKNYSKHDGIIVPKAALNKYVTLGYVITNDMGSLLIVLPSIEKVK